MLSDISTIDIDFMKADYLLVSTPHFLDSKDSKQPVRLLPVVHHRDILVPKKYSLV